MAPSKILTNSHAKVGIVSYAVSCRFPRTHTATSKSVLTMKRTFDMLSFYFMGWANKEELFTHIKKTQRARNQKDLMHRIRNPRLSAC